MDKREPLLNLDNPTVQCNVCFFENVLSGTWTVENGRLVFRADADPLQTRGPDFHHCAESSEVTEFTSMTFDYGQQRFSDEDFRALQATSEAASPR
jgi:hypothetical protein